MAILGFVTLATSALAQPPVVEVQEVAQTGSMPKGAALSPDGTKFFVTNFGQANGNNITMYDASSLSKLGTIDVPGIVVESVLSPDGSLIYASNFTRDSVQYIDVATKSVKKEIQTGAHPKILVLTKDGSRLFVANWDGASVSIVDTAKGVVTRTLPVGLHPRGMALTTDGTLFVANFDGASIDVFSGPDFGFTHRLPVCPIPRHLALSPDEKTLFISCYHDSELHAMSVATESVEHKVSIGKNPKSIEVSPDGKYVYSADYGPSNSVSVVDTTDWLSRTYTVPGLDRGSGIAVTRDGQHALVTGWCDNHIYLVGFVGTGGHPTETRDKIAHTMQGHCTAPPTANN